MARVPAGVTMPSAAQWCSPAAAGPSSQPARAPGQAMTRSVAIRAGPVTSRPAPRARPVMTQHLGTSASWTAWASIMAREMAPGSADGPAESIRNTSGSPKASQVQTSRVAFRHSSAAKAPWIASTPTGRPSSRARPVTRAGAKSRRSSKNDPRSTRPSMSSRGSGPGFRSGCWPGAVTGRGLPAAVGRNDKKRRIAA